jgi:hypothetical protein
VPSARKERKKHIFACACQSRIIVRVGSTLYLPNMFSSEELLLIGIHLDKKKSSGTAGNICFPSLTS